MKKFIFFIVFIFSFIFILADSVDDSFLVRKYQGIAIGQLTLAHRLISLATSLSISKSVENDYIISLLKNIDSTIDNTKSIIENNNNKPDMLTKEILSSIDFFINCSESVKKYTLDQNYDNLSKVRSCVENSSSRIDKLTDIYNNEKQIDTNKNNKKVPSKERVEKKTDN
jgi:hypothetical protein